MERRSALLVMISGMTAGMIVWAVSTQFWSLAAFALIYGVFYGGWVAVLPVGSYTLPILASVCANIAAAGVIAATSRDIVRSGATV